MTLVMKRRRVFILVLVFLLIGLSTACSQTAQPPEDDDIEPTVVASADGDDSDESDTDAAGDPEVPEEPHGRLVIGTSGMRVDIAPQEMISNYDIGNPMFDGLTWPRENGVLEPRLATSWRLLDDNVTWEFELRDDVTFDNGEKFTAEVVKYTIETTLNEQLRWFGRIATIKEVNVVDDYTVQIVTHAPDPLLPGRMMLFMLSPQGVEEAGGLAEYGKSPSGTGAYELVEFEPGVRALMRLREDSWRSGGDFGAPNKPLEIEWVNLPDAASRMAALRAGEIDVAMNVPFDEVATLEEDGFVSTSVVEASPTITFLDVFCDCPFADKLVRQAVNYAIDKEAMVNDLYLGYPQVEEGQLVGPDGFGHHPDIEAYPYDPDMARQLLADAGYPDGFSTTLEIVANNPIAGETTGEAIAAYLADVGITAEIVPMEAGVWIGKWYGGGRDEMFMGFTNYLPLYDADFSYSWFWSGNQPEPARFMSNERFDELFEAQRQEIDEDARLEMLLEMAEILHEEAPVLFLFRQGRVHVMDPGVHNLELQSDQMIYPSFAYEDPE